MIAPALEVAEVIRRYGPAYLDVYGEVTSAGQHRVLRDLTRCRTAALGGHVEACDECGHRQIAYNSCRNRHCPKCQGLACARWMEDRAAELLPVEYFHVVFTLPSRLGPLAMQNPRLVYGTLFRAAAETINARLRAVEHPIVHDILNSPPHFSVSLCLPPRVPRVPRGFFCGRGK